MSASALESPLTAAAKRKSYGLRHREAFKQRVLDMQQASRLIEAQDRLSRTLQKYSARRRAEQQLAAAFEQDGGGECGIYHRPRLERYLHDMKTCRTHGVAGVKPDGRVVVAWSSKCNCLRLCPDEARQDQVRVLKKDLDHILAAKREGLVVYKLVLSPPNYPRNELHAAKRAVFAEWKALIKAKNGHGEKALPNFRGALVVQEDPLGSAGDWNVHLNVILLLEKLPGKKYALDYQDFRQWWPWACDIKSERDMVESSRKVLKARGVDVAELTEADVFAFAIKECIKYPVQAISEKSDRHAGGWIEDRYFDAELEPAAPPMTEWPQDARIEWYDANQGFRRLRTYGDLYDPKGLELPDQLDEGTHWFAALDLEGGTWKVSRPWLDKLYGASLFIGSIRRGISTPVEASSDAEKPPDTGPPPLWARAAILASSAERQFYNVTFGPELASEFFSRRDEPWRYVGEATP